MKPRSSLVEPGFLFVMPTRLNSWLDDGHPEDDADELEQALYDAIG